MSAALLAVTLSLASQVVVLDDPLRGSTSGTRNGGELGADGWLVTGTADYIYWHLPTLRAGAVEFSVRGLPAQEDRIGIEDKAELFHMYDWTFEDADTNYTGYRNNPFKHFIRKTGVLDDRPGRTDSCEMLWLIAPNYVEPDTGVLSWDPNVTYRFREEWGPDGAGNTVIRTYRDGAEIMTMSEPGEWAPQGHAIRIGVARLTAESGAPLDAVFSDVQAWDLSPTMPPDVEPAPFDALPQGPVRVVGNSLVDDNGAFLGLGATYMTALWQVKNDRALLESDLTLFQTSGYNYLRILGQVGGDYWSGLEIAPVDLLNEDGTAVPAWPDYVQQLQDLLDAVWAHGMRTQITIFGGASNIEGGLAARQAVIDMVLTAIAGREEKVILIEVANEGWHTGFPGSEGLDEMRAFANDLAARTEVPVAITSNHDVNSIEETYQGAQADIATWHTSRDLGVDEGWGPVHDSWRLDGAAGVPPVSSNEPIGPGSSVASESSPIRLVMAAAFAYVAKLPMYVFHSSAGVRHADRFEDMAGVRDFANVRRLLRGDVASWTRNDGIEASAPFTASGSVRCTGARRGDLFVTIPIGIRPEGLTLEARAAISFAVYDPISGALLSEHALAAGEQLMLPQGGGAYVLTNVDPNAGGSELDAAFVAQDVPAAMIVGQAHRVSITMRNTGTLPWSGAALGAKFSGDRIALAEDVAPGVEKTFDFAVLAPEVPGRYDFSWQMIQGAEWFGEITPAVSVQVLAEDAETPDAGSTSDATTMKPDATTTDDPSLEGDPSCSCTATSSGELASPLWIVAAVLLLVTRSRDSLHKSRAEFRPWR